MTVRHLWLHALGGFSGKPHKALSFLRGKKVAFDGGILLNKVNNRELTKLTSTNEPTYASPEILDYVEEFHNLVIDAGITPCYVFDGKAPPIKNREKLRRQGDRDKGGEEYDKFLCDVLQLLADDPSLTFEEDDVERAIASRKKKAHPTACDHAAVISWMASKDIWMVGSLFEADQQMRKLEMDGVVDAIATEDGDLIILNSEMVLSKWQTKTGELFSRVYDKREFMEQYKTSKLVQHPNNVVDIALLLGNDYHPNIPFVGKVTVLKDGGLIDQLAAAPDREEFVKQLGSTYKKAPANFAEDYEAARRYLLHAPVFEKCEMTGKVSIVPLNPLPEGVDDLETYLDIKFDRDAAISPNQYDDVYHVRNIVPLTGKSVDEERGPCYSAAENATIDSNVTLPTFARLDLKQVPLQAQPILCMKLWLQARGIKTLQNDSRSIIERNVRWALTNNKPVLPPSIKVLMGKYDGFEALQTRIANNKFDTWDRDYFTLAKLVADVSDTYMEEKLNGALPGMRERALLLLKGGNINPLSIRCCNVTSKIDNSPCVLMRCEALSSVRSVIHTVHAVFEDKESGDFLSSPLSTCSCEDGSLFCSHMIAFLLLLGLVQRSESQMEFEREYPVSPELTQAEPVLIENLHALDIFNRQQGQAKRHAGNKRKRS